MKQYLGTLALGLLGLAALAQPASSLSIGLQPLSTSSAVGDTFALDVVVSGLGPQGTAPSVGAFDLDLGFAPTMVALMNVSFGTLLGNPGLGEALTDIKSGAALVNFAEVSLLPSATLDALQPDSFLLATLTFRATASGTSTLALSRAVVSDGFGKALPVDSLGAAQVSASAPSVPEPTGFVLFALGLATAGAFAGKHAAERKSRRRVWLRKT